MKTTRDLVKYSLGQMDDLGLKTLRDHLSSGGLLCLDGDYMDSEKC